MSVRSTQIDEYGRLPGWRGGRAGAAFFAEGVLVAVGLLAGGIGGCANPPPAAATNLVLTEQEARQAIELSDTEMTEVRRAFQSLAAGHRAVNPPSPAKGGIDWNDAELAVSQAVSEVEATVVSIESAEDGSSHRFLIRTVEDYPGEVVIRRVDGPAVYVAEAWIGRFPTEPHHVERARKIIEGIDKEFKRLGKQRWFRKPD